MTLTCRNTQLREQYEWVLPMHAVLGVLCGLLAAAFIQVAAFFFKVTRPWARDGQGGDSPNMQQLRCAHVMQSSCLVFAQYPNSSGISLMTYTYLRLCSHMHVWGCPLAVFDQYKVRVLG